MPAPKYIIESIEFERPGESAPRVIASHERRLNPDEVKSLTRSLFQVSRFPGYPDPVPHAIRILDEQGKELFRWDDWIEMRAVQEDNKRKREEAKRLLDDA